jgi:predicted GH43/DUF377 family glycosyl hydrolase
MRRCVLLVLGLGLLSACGRYGDFTLPPPAGAERPVQWVWEDSGSPVLARGPASAFDSVDALNPSIVAVAGKLWNFYSGWDGRQWRTGLATSTDQGLSWTRHPSALLAPDPAAGEGSYISANGATVHQDGQFLHWYQAGAPPEIALATSPDGLNWTRHGIVLPRGPRGAWDELGVADPYVIAAGGQLYLFHLGQDRARRQRLGVAVSADAGRTWTKLRSNPILEIGAPGRFDSLGLGEPAVWTSHGRWWMLYTGRDRAERRKIGLAVSKDGIHWERTSESPLIAGQAPWNAQVVCDPEILPLPDGSLRVWYGGGDAPQPAENLNGQIGLGRLIPR